MSKPKEAPPTLEQFSKYQKAWEYFNRELFGGTLRPCLLNFSRHRGSRGFFTPGRWKKGDQEIHEISLNPTQLLRPLEEIMSTLAHEMTHQWQFDHGTPPRRNYHDTEWAVKMEEIGLIPSNTGEPGGNRTGQSMTHYIDPDGKFTQAMRRMPKEYILPWVCDEQEKPSTPKVPKKIKLTCPVCEVNVWIMAEDEGHQILCEECGDYFLTKDELRERREDENEGD